MVEFSLMFIYDISDVYMHKCFTFRMNSLRYAILNVRLYEGDRIDVRVYVPNVESE